jgi:hypothetical protein
VGDTHAASQWQVRLAGGEYSSPVYDSGVDTVNLTSITVGDGVLNHVTEYYWRVRHQDDGGLWSDWSFETSFRTSDTPEGIDVSVYPDSTDVNFDQVVVDGCTSVRRSWSTPPGHSEPAHPPAWRLGPFVDVTTTASHAGTITVGLPFQVLGGQHEVEGLGIYHWNGSVWENVTSFIDFGNGMIYGEVSSLSWFYIGGRWVWVGQSAPVAPNAFAGIAAAFGAVVVAYFVRRKLILQD